MKVQFLIHLEASFRSSGSCGVLHWLQHCLAHYWHRGTDGLDVLCASKNVTTSLFTRNMNPRLDCDAAAVEKGFNAYVVVFLSCLLFLFVDSE